MSFAPKKELFYNVRTKVPMATRPMGGGEGLKALVAGPLRKELFFAASLTKAIVYQVIVAAYKKQERTSFYRSEDHRIFITKNRT